MLGFALLLVYLGARKGILFLLFSLLLKLGCAPFHVWVTHFYGALPLRLACWFAVIPKLAIVTLLLTAFSFEGGKRYGIISILARLAVSKLSKHCIFG
jgi:NADH:ubiquinone oxidoreductase subunit 2 (subunit N)